MTNEPEVSSIEPKTNPLKHEVESDAHSDLEVVQEPSNGEAEVGDPENEVVEEQASAQDEQDDEEEKEDDSEPGDDVGNRLPGAAASPPGAAKKKRRRHKKGKSEGGASTEGAAQHGENGGQRKSIVPRERQQFSVGEEVFGRVSKITDQAIWIDISGKAIGLFDRREILDEEAPQEGDQFIATVASASYRGTMVVLSRNPVQLDESRAKLEAALKSGELVEGLVTGAMKGGVEVDVGGIRAFAPASHVDLHPGTDLSHLAGQRLEFFVVQYAKKGRDVVVSRKKMLEEEQQQNRAEALAKIQVGNVYKGIVKKIVAWGVFVALPDADGAQGLIHLTEASHDRSAKLADLFKVGEETEVKVLSIDDKGKLWLSRKAVVPDPWEATRQKYAPGTRHKGKVVRIQPFGAFVELEPGIDGLCHIADLSIKPIDHPNKVLKVDDEVEFVVASCDARAKRIALHPAPPAEDEGEAPQRVVQYKSVKVAVVQVVEGGVLARIVGLTGRAARAFIPANHTGTPRGNDLRKDFPVGTKLEAKVLETDPKRGETKVSIRALREDTEKQAYQQYRKGVEKEAKFGTFADLFAKMKK